MWDTIRKFGLQYSELPTMVWNVASMLRLLILNIDRRNTKRILFSYIQHTLIGSKDDVESWAGFYDKLKSHMILSGLYLKKRYNGDKPKTNNHRLKAVAALIICAVRLQFVCPLCPSNCTMKDLYMATDQAVAVANFWVVRIRTNDSKKKKTFASKLPDHRIYWSTLALFYLDKSCFPISSYVIMVVLSVMYVYVLLISMYWFAFVRAPQTGELMCAIICFSLGVTSEIGVTKLIGMFLYKNTIKDIVDQLLSFDASVQPGSRFSRNLMKHLRVVKKRALVFWLIIMGDTGAFVLKPFFIPGRHLLEDCFVYYGLEPMFDSPNYEISVICTIGSMFFACYLPANITAFFIILSGYTEAQILALSEELNHLYEDAERNYIETQDDLDRVDSDVDGHNFHNKMKIINENIRKRLIYIVQIHSTNINLLRQVDSIFRWPIAIEFMLVTMGLIAELLGGLEKTYMMLLYALMFIGIDCLIGQRMMDACMIFENAVYNCKWENFDVSNMKIVLLMLQASQKGIVLSAGGIAPLNYPCFMTVIRSIYSAYTTLRSAM